MCHGLNHPRKSSQNIQANPDRLAGNRSLLTPTIDVLVDYRIATFHPKPFPVTDFFYNSSSSEKH